MKKFFEAHVDSPPVYPHLPPVANKLLWLRGFKIHIQVTIMKYILKWPYPQFFFIFPSDPIFHAVTFGEKKISIWLKSVFFYEVLKPENPILLRSTQAADHIIDVLRFVT